MSEGESLAAGERRPQINEVEAYSSFLRHLFPLAVEILVNQDNIEDVKRVTKEVFDQAAPYVPLLSPTGRSTLQRRTAFTDRDVRFLQGLFALEGKKKSIEELAKEENISHVRRFLGRATNVLRHAQFAKPLRQFARFPELQA